MTMRDIFFWPSLSSPICWNFHLKFINILCIHPASAFSKCLQSFCFDLFKPLLCVCVRPVMIACWLSDRHIITAVPHLPWSLNPSNCTPPLCSWGSLPTASGLVNRPWLPMLSRTLVTSAILSHFTVDCCRYVMPGCAYVGILLSSKTYVCISVTYECVHSCNIWMCA